MHATQQTQYARIPVWLRELQFVTDFFTWLFALMARLSEPFMLICTLYIVAEAGVPVIALAVLHNLAIGIMITAPELILPGAFVVASQAQEHARVLFAVCWTFILLTLLTLLSLFVWHFTGASLAWLMCARCATAVGYSILMRVMNMQHQGEQTATKTRDVAPDLTLTSLKEQLTAFTNSVESVTMGVTDLRTRVTQMSMASTPIALPRPATTCEYIAFSTSERRDQMATRATTYSDYALFEYGGMSDEGLDGWADSRSMKPHLLHTATEAKREGDQHEQGATRASSVASRIREALMHDPNLSDREIASMVGCSNSTVNKWRRRIEVA